MSSVEGRRGPGADIESRYANSVLIYCYETLFLFMAASAPIDDERTKILEKERDDANHSLKQAQESIRQLKQHLVGHTLFVNETLFTHALTGGNHARKGCSKADRGPAGRINHSIQRKRTAGYRPENGIGSDAPRTVRIFFIFKF